jgi:hypothetical protein
MRLQPLDPDQPAEEAGVPPVGRSALDDLRRAFNAIDDSKEQTRVFPVAGSRAGVRYRRLLVDDRNNVLTPDGTTAKWERNAQMLIDACDEIGFFYINDQGEPDLHPMIEGQTVTFDLRPGETISLAKALDEHEDDVRRSVLRLFRGVDAALLDHAAAVDAWMDTIHAGVEETFQEG